MLKYCDVPFAGKVPREVHITRLRGVSLNPTGYTPFRYGVRIGIVNETHTVCITFPEYGF